MPPPLPVESDVESVADEITYTNAESAKKEEPTDTKMIEANGKEDEEEEEDDDDEDGVTYIVEKILDHRSDFEDNVMRYHVKWKGYEKKSDRTWETEENLEGAREILEAYWQSIGGKPVVNEKPAKKRGRQSTGATQSESAKKPKTTKTTSGRGRKSNAGLEQDATPPGLVGYTEEGEDDWKPPPANKDSWDPLVQSVDTVVRESSDGELWGYLIWNEKNDDGRFYRSKAKVSVIYRACPQRMLNFYEKHLVFSTNSEQPDNAAGDEPQS